MIRNSLEIIHIIVAEANSQILFRQRTGAIDFPSFIRSTFHTYPIRLRWPSTFHGDSSFPDQTRRQGALCLWPQTIACQCVINASILFDDDDDGQSIFLQVIIIIGAIVVRIIQWATERHGQLWRLNLQGVGNCLPIIIRCWIGRKWETCIGWTSLTATFN